MEVNFTAAIHFTRKIAGKMLAGVLPFDADVLKVEIPLGASVDTKYVVTKQDRLVYYQPSIEERQTLFGSRAKVFHVPSKGKYTSKDTDAYALAEGLVSITPLSLDLTSRGSLNELAKFLGTSVLKDEG